MSTHHHGLYEFVALALALPLASGCHLSRPSERLDTWRSNITTFEEELQDLQSALAIPGVAYAIVENGETIATGAFGVERGSGQTRFTTDTPLRIASVTKALTAIVALQLVEEGRLDLDAPARRYAPALKLPDEVLVKHLLTHTSEGNVGTEYVYGTNRYAMLGNVIEAISGERFEDVIRRRVLERARMRLHPSPALGPHAGLVATTGDMAAYLGALDRGNLLGRASLARLALPSRSPAGTALPVSLGWFAQTVQERQVVWSFGQDDPEHSGALLLRVPSRNLSLFILANDNVLSDPFRLLMGDVTKSPFAMSFMRLFAFSMRGEPLGRPRRNDPALSQQLSKLESASTYRYRDELLAWMLIDLWKDSTATAQAKYDVAGTRYQEDVPDPVMHFAALRLPEVRTKDKAIEDGMRLLAAHPTNRWILLAQGYLLQQRGRMTEAAVCFRNILGLPNQEADFLWRLFRVWSWMALAQISADGDPQKARAYLREIVGSGVTGGLLDEAKRMLDNLERRRQQ
jgi:CubicO group peptidase (beta-lactamase class C family)